MNKPDLVARKRRIEEQCGFCGAVAGFACTGFAMGQPIIELYWHTHYVDQDAPEIASPFSLLQNRVKELERKQARYIWLFKALVVMNDPKEYSAALRDATIIEIEALC